jgi:2-C-methyl-D-erythritol 2,4-cyclodiphosphate synthase
VLGGVEIPYDMGLDGWSDADSLTHAIIDALLGAAALGDIGKHFPSGKAEYKDISSLEMLKQVRFKLEKSYWYTGNIDATVIAEKPMLADYITGMRKKLSKTLELKIDRINIKASTANGLGEIGRGEGIAAIAVVIIEGED